MDSAIRAPSEYAIDGVEEGAVITNDFGFKLTFSVMTDRQRGPVLHLHAETNAEHAARLVLEFERLQIFMNGVGDLSNYDRSRIFDLLGCEKSAALANMAAIGAMARSWCFYARTGRNLEVAETFFDRALSADISVLIGIDRNAELSAKISQMVGHIDCSN